MAHDPSQYTRTTLEDHETTYADFNGGVTVQTAVLTKAGRKQIADAYKNFGENVTTIVTDLKNTGKKSYEVAVSAINTVMDKVKKTEEDISRNGIIQKDFVFSPGDGFACVDCDWSSYITSKKSDNPITEVAQTEIEPVYDRDGKHIGNTKEGFTGQVLIYSGDENVDFSTMSADEAKKIEGVDTYDNERGVLSGDTKSNIWTDIVSKKEGTQIYDETFRMSDLREGKIHYDEKEVANWAAYYGLGKGKGKITGSDKYKYETTVENIQSSVLVHELYSHIKKNQDDKFNSHRLAYKNVINFKAFWEKTTNKYKGFIVRRLLYYTGRETGRETVDPPYRNLFNKYSKYK